MKEKLLENVKRARETYEKLDAKSKILFTKIVSGQASREEVEQEKKK